MGNHRARLLWGLWAALWLAGCGDDDGMARDAGEHEIRGGDAGDGDGAGELGSGDAGAGDGDAEGHPGSGDGGTADAGVQTDAGGDGDGDGDAEPLTFASYCETLYDATCAWWTSCTEQPCDFGPTTLLRNACEDAEALEATGRYAFDAERAEPCLELHAPAADADSCQWGPPPLFIGNGFGPSPAPNACTGVIAGTIEPGGACYPNDFFLSEGCAEGYCRQDGGCPGTCEAFVGEGGPCTDGVRCARTLYCSSSDNTCHAYLEQGDDCTGGDARCGADLYCLSSGSCVPRAEEGELCEDYPHCAQGLNCEPISANAAQRICVVPQTVGGPCSSDASCYYPYHCDGATCTDAPRAPGDDCRGPEECPAGTNCRDDGEGRKCVAALADGEPCDFHDDCEVEHICSAIPADATYRCYAWGLQGEPCGPRGCADGLFCDAGSCAPNSGEGGPCDPELGNCQPGLRCMDDGQCHDAGDVGEPCSIWDDGSCLETLFCQVGSSTCAAPVGEGQACNSAFWQERTCQAGLYCQDPPPCEEVSCPPPPASTCQPEIPDGSPCDDNDQGCASQYCLGGTCTTNTGCRSL